MDDIPAVVDERLWVERLRLTDFRNYRSASLELDARVVVLTGPNGAGKTNLLEAVSLLSAGQGLRGAPFSDLARMERDETASGLWAVSARVHTSNGQMDIGTGLELPANSSARSGRTVKLDGRTLRGTGMLGEHIHMVWLTPALDRLFTGPASERRRFLGQLIVGLDPTFRKRVSNFERAMRQRNRLFEHNVFEAAQFVGLEMQMAETGVAMAAARLHTVDRLAAAIELKWSQNAASPFPWSTLALEGPLERDLRTMPALDVEDIYAQSLANGRERDRAAKRTLTGPHRTDLLVGHGPKAMPAKLCSTGEQKALLVGMMLAYSELVKQLRGGYAPIILLDEIAAHLDETRRKALFDEIIILGAQAWMTGTDASIFAPFGERAQFYSIENAGII